jgi:hypothetical protein
MRWLADTSSPWSEEAKELDACVLCQLYKPAPAPFGKAQRNDSFSTLRSASSSTPNRDSQATSSLATDVRQTLETSKKSSDGLRQGPSQTCAVSTTSQIIIGGTLKALRHSRSNPLTNLLKESPVKGAPITWTEKEDFAYIGGA